MISLFLLGRFKNNLGEQSKQEYYNSYDKIHNRY